MADIGRILYLPPAVVTGRAAGIPGEDRARQAVPAVETDAANADANQARAKQFRFRVYDGGRPDQTLAGDNGLPTRRTGNARADEAERGSQGNADANTGRTQNFASGFTTASAPFLAQLIAQEQLQAGLHDPPLRQADRAYRQAGGEPALGEGSRGRFRIAI